MNSVYVNIHNEIHFYLLSTTGGIRAISSLLTCGFPPHHSTSWGEPLKLRLLLCLGSPLTVGLQSRGGAEGSGEEEPELRGEEPSSLNRRCNKFVQGGREFFARLYEALASKLIRFLYMLTHPTIGNKSLHSREIIWLAHLPEATKVLF